MASYTVEFFPYPNKENESGYADAQAVVRPPFDVSRAGKLLEELVLGDVEIEDYATTESASVLELSYELNQAGGVASTEVEVFELMEASLAGIVSRLNEIESGDFPKRVN